MLQLAAPWRQPTEEAPLLALFPFPSALLLLEIEEFPLRRRPLQLLLLPSRMRPLGVVMKMRRRRLPRQM